MDTVNIHAAKTNFSQLVQRAAAGETIVIARSGRPLARLVPIDDHPAVRRLGFLADGRAIPDDFDHLGGDEIASAFTGE